MSAKNEQSSLLIEMHTFERSNDSCGLNIDWNFYNGPQHISHCVECHDCSQP